MRIAADMNSRFDGGPGPEAAGRPRNFTPLARNSQRARVLVVDDDSLTRWSLSETLGARGYAVAEAPDAASAISALLSPPPRIAVVLLDVYLPDADDLRVLKALRQMAPDTPVILMTAYGSRELSAEATRLGAFAVLDKPFELDVVGPMIERALEARPH